ncbi:MAG: DUF4129 domain-containing protein [Stackebrandtia sp.]
MEKSPWRWLPVVAVSLALAVLGLVVASVELSSQAAPPLEFEPYEEYAGSESPSPSPLFEEPSGEAEPTERNDLFGVVGQLFTVAAYGLIALVAAALIAYGTRRLLTTRPSGWDRVDSRAAAQPSAEEMRDALQAGLVDIDAGGDPRAAVIACWLRLEHAAADAGVARLASETPAELVQRVLAACRVDDRALSELADAYRRARYAPHDVDVDLRQRARAALAAVDAQLAAAAAEGAAT